MTYNYHLINNLKYPLCAEIYQVALITSLSKSNENHFLNYFLVQFTYPGALMWSEAFRIHYSHFKRLWMLTSLSHCNKCIEIPLGVIDYNYKEGCIPHCFMSFLKAGPYWYCEGFFFFSFNHILIPSFEQILT